MAVFRINKTDKYTVMSNRHFLEKDMSLKAKGLLSLMLSLPDDWDYSIKGLVGICKENESAIKSTLNELKAFGYLVIKKKMPNETKSGRLEYEYNIFEQPQIEKQEVEKQEVEKQGVENQPLEFQPLENQGQLNTNNKILINSLYIGDNEPQNPPPVPAPKNTSDADPEEMKQTYGEFKNVKLSAEEVEKLKKAFPTDWNNRIESLSAYMESTGKKYKSHYATIKNWERRDKEYTQKPSSRPSNRTPKPQRKASYDIDKAEQNARNRVPELRKKEQR